MRARQLYAITFNAIDVRYALYAIRAAFWRYTSKMELQTACEQIYKASQRKAYQDTLTVKVERGENYVLLLTLNGRIIAEGEDAALNMRKADWQRKIERDYGQREWNASKDKACVWHSVKK